MDELKELRSLVNELTNKLDKLGNKLTADDKKYQQKSGMVYPCKRGNYHKAGR